MQPLDLSPGFDVSAAQRAVEGALRGTGSPLWPVTGADPAPGARSFRPEVGLAAVLPTSGSTGTAKRVLLTAGNLRASAGATHDRLGGPGQWLLALPAQHVAGFLVLCRSVLAGTTAVPLRGPGPFSTARFVAAVAAMRPHGRRYAALVPTQLARLVREPAGREALARLDAVLLGGAPLPDTLRAVVREHRLPVVTTYGMTETTGGCVYDGTPLPGVRVEILESRVRIGGEVVAAGYWDDAAATADRFSEHAGTRWFRTDDLAGWAPEGRLRVLGRADAVINTGGHKVLAADVEAALRSLPGVREAHVEGVPDAEWGTRVAALVVPDPYGPDAGRSAPPAEAAGRLREALRPLLPGHALPRQVLVVEALPLLPSGKTDRVRARQLLARGDGRL